MTLKNQGFSLIGTIVAAAAGVIIMTALSQQTLSQARSTRYLEAKMEAMNLRQELTLLLGSDPNCDGSFTGLTGINVAGAVGGDSTDITTALNTPAGRPLRVLKDNYNINNRLISIASISLFKPEFTIAGPANTTNPYEFKLRMTVQAKTGAMSTVVEGPTFNLDALGGTVNPATACGAAAAPAVVGELYGGMYINTWECGGGCISVNPFTGGCSCPAGYSASSVMVRTYAGWCGGAREGTLIICYK